MNFRTFGLIVCATAFAALAQGQQYKAQGQQYKAPLAGDGHPDLQGFWANNNATPVERPKELADHPMLTTTNRLPSGAISKNSPRKGRPTRGGK